jgi:glycerophosphoryl diester phosphodiesterase
MLIIAHRANITGPEPRLENSLARTREVVARGWSLETDIRRDSHGRFYISHDVASWSPENDAAAFCAAWREARGLVALNIKELGYEAELIAYLRSQQVLEHVFLFDMELLEPAVGVTAETFRTLDAKVRLGARTSDRNETVMQALGIACADIVWLDEFDQLWATAEHVRAIQAAGRSVYAVSPELHHKSIETMRSRWVDFVEWGVDGICTDHPEGLEQVLRQAASGAQCALAS